MIKSSPCRARTASSSPPNGILLLFLHHSCLLLSDAGFRTLALHVSLKKKKEKNNEMNYINYFKCIKAQCPLSGTDSSTTVTGSEVICSTESRVF